MGMCEAGTGVWRRRNGEEERAEASWRFGIGSKEEEEVGGRVCWVTFL